MSYRPRPSRKIKEKSPSKSWKEEKFQCTSTQQQSSGTANKHDKLRQVDFSSESSSVNTFCNSFLTFFLHSFSSKDRRRGMSPRLNSPSCITLQQECPPPLPSALCCSSPFRSSQGLTTLRERKKIVQKCAQYSIPLMFLAIMAIFGSFFLL